MNSSIFECKSQEDEFSEIIAGLDEKGFELSARFTAALTNTVGLDVGALYDEARASGEIKGRKSLRVWQDKIDATIAIYAQEDARRQPPARRLRAQPLHIALLQFITDAALLQVKRLEAQNYDKG